MSQYLAYLDFKEEEKIYLLDDNKINKTKIYKVLNIYYEEGGSYHDGYEVKIFANLEEELTNIIGTFKVAFFSNQNRIKSITAFNLKNLNND